MKECAYLYCQKVFDPRTDKRKIYCSRPCGKLASGRRKHIERYRSDPEYRAHKLKVSREYHAKRSRDSVYIEKRNHQRKMSRLNAYGLNAEQYKAMLIHQDFRCSICKVGFDEKNWPCIDHDHSTNKVRELLCSRCNLIISCEDTIILTEAIRYLEKHKNNLIHMLSSSEV